MKTKRYVFCSESEARTEKAGVKLAGMARGVVCIEGDLGAGKTVLVRGIAKGLGIKDYITSPTFNIINVYEADGFTFNHMDAYRITDPEMLYDIGFEEMVDSAELTVIEWADMILEAVGDCGMKVRMTRGATDNKRIIAVESSVEIIDEFIRSFK